jgi:hypothetical protein
MGVFGGVNVHIVENRNKAVGRTYCYACQCTWDKERKKYVKKGISIGRLEGTPLHFVPNKNFGKFLNLCHKKPTDENDAESINNANKVIDAVSRKYGENVVSACSHSHQEDIVREYINAKSKQEQENIKKQYNVSGSTIKRWYREIRAKDDPLHKKVGILVKTLLDERLLEKEDFPICFGPDDLAKICKMGYVTEDKHIESIKTEANDFAKRIIEKKEVANTGSARRFQSLVLEIFDILKATEKEKNLLKNINWEELSSGKNEMQACSAIKELIYNRCKLEIKDCTHLCYAQTAREKWNETIKQVQQIAQNYGEYFYIANLPSEIYGSTPQKYFIKKVIPRDAKEHHLYVHYANVEKAPEIDAFIIAAKADNAAEIVWMGCVFCCDSQQLMTETLSFDMLYSFMEKQLFAEETILKIVSKRGLDKKKKTRVSNFSAFYRNFGFKPNGTLKNYWGKGHDAYVWIKWNPVLSKDFTS